MDNLINYGIDLGTTNSVIAKFVKGEVKVFNNPQDFGRCTLPSVVGFKKDKIIVGTKAKEYSEKEPKNVVGIFKRKMGTSETYKIKSINESKTPVDLSSIVLKELKTFLPPEENLDSIVITIPASFDTVQSNATKEAGIKAGFKQVILLQEPIAASLAYANMKKEKDLKEGQWLVYDLGGGTFDVALVKIANDEMKILDHEGDNFLGGTDFDRFIVEKIIFPKLLEKYKFNNLEEDMKSASGKYNAKYYVLLHNAEKAKILLCSQTSADIEASGFEDDDNNEIDLEIIVTRSEFNNLIREYIDSTIEMIKKILTRNSLKTNELQFILMVGGSTYIPYVRQRVEEVLQIPANCNIDPTTAVAIGAAYYAATKPKEIRKDNFLKTNHKINIKAAYEKSSKEKEEFFSAKISGNTNDLFYRITREDGGYDSGLKKLTERINEDLPLVENSYNYFKLTVYDAQNNVVETGFEMIGINSGFGISGQPLPEDICIEVDDIEKQGETKLELIFPKNTILPTKRTITKTLNKTIIKNSNDEVILINVLEGPHTSLPSANKRFGLMKITGKNISRDIAKGSDIELTITMSESRDLSVSAYLAMADQEFKEILNTNLRHTDIEGLKMDIEDLSDKLNSEIEEAVQNEKFEVAKELKTLKNELDKVAENAEKLCNDDVTDQRYQVEDKKRKIAQEVDNATKDKRFMIASNEYFEAKNETKIIIDKFGNDYERKHYNDIIAQEDIFLKSTTTLKIYDKISELKSLHFSILWRDPEFLKAIFKDLEQSRTKFNNQEQAKSLIDAGKLAIRSENWDRLSEVISGLINLLPKSEQEAIKKTKIGFN